MPLGLVLLSGSAFNNIFIIYITKVRIFLIYARKNQDIFGKYLGFCNNLTFSSRYVEHFAKVWVQMFR